MKLLQTKYGATIIFLTILFVFGLSQERALAANFRVCPIDGGVGDDDFSQNGTITINSAQTFQANVSNKGVIDCGVLNLVINSTITAQSFIATPFDANPDDDFGVLFKTTGDITISATAKIIADNQGYAAGQGPGTSATSASAGGGSYGNYAGCGGSNGRSCPQPPYGSSFNPRSLGSGGGNGQNRQFVAGGSGGGAITLEAKNITLDGEILARGGNGGGILGRYGQNAASGGGAGGSILIKASADLRGNGRLSVRGGNGGEYGDYKGGGGSGGRIALYYSSYDFLISTLQTNFEIGGGTAVSTGENGRIGTFAMFDNSKTPFSSRVFGNFEFRFNDAQDGKFSFSDFTIERNGIVYLQNGDDKVLKLEIAGNLMNDGDFRCGDGIKKGLNLLVGGDFTLGNGARMSCNANGYGSGEGPGAGEQGSSAGGAGHGGKGSVGIGNGIGIGGVFYDDYQLPKEGGSGGGIGQNRSTISGGNGGGSLEIIVGKDAIIDGKLAANGNNGLSEAGNFGQNVASGGGAGGTIYLKALNLYGTGRIEANGGNGGVITGYIGGGGSGGRVAIYYLNHSGTILDGCGDGLSENCLNILAKLGREGTNGENGTIFINKEPPPTPEEIFIDEGPAQPIEDQQDGNNGESPDENNARIQTLSCVKLYGKTASWPLSMGSGELNFDALTGSVESLSTCIHLNEGSKETIQPVGQDSYTGLGNVMEGWVWNTNVGWLSFNCKDIEQILGNDSFCELGSRYQVYRDKDGFLRGYGWGTKVGWVWFNFQDGCADCAQNGDADFRPRLDEIITDPNDLNVGKGLLHGYGWNPRVGYINLEGAFVRPSCVTEDCIVPPEIVTDMPRSFLCSTDTDMSYIYRPKLVPNTGTPEVLYDGGKILGEPEVTFDPLAPEMKMTITKEFCASIPQDGKKNVDLEIRAWNNHTTGGGWGSLGGEDLKRWTVSIINSCAQTSTITCVPVAPTTDINSAWLGKHYEVDCTANAAQEGGAAPTQPLTWSLEGGIPAGMIHVGIDGDTGLKRKIIYDPPDSGIPEDYYIRVRGQNACSNATFGYILKLDAQIPEITSSCPTSILHDLVEYRYQPITLGAKPINFSITPNQKIKNYNEREMLIDSQTGRVYNWLSPNIFPNKEDRGYSFELSARNNYGSDTETCNFTVVSEAIPPIVDISTKLNGAIRYYTLGKNLPFSYEYRLLKGTQPIDWSFEGDLQGIATIQDGRFTWNLNPEEEESHEANRYEVINLKASNAASKPEENFYWARETEDPANPYIPEEPDRFTIVPGYAPVINI
ncbi:hypothetical protein HY605_04960, partial [Candidatus Peregrinibacteria bacterium]|nr:hypothetical protein [Candidatus Peregrinibacteria bacterium]